MTSTDRMPQIDALRGFALLGVCVVNAPVIAGAWILESGPDKSSIDHIVAWLVTALFTTKFYLLFSFLFGYSFAIQMDVAERDRASFRRRHARRLLGLLVIGSIHAVLLYPGDILTTYAALGIPLFIIRRIHQRTALLIALGLIIFLALTFAVTGVLALGFEDTSRVSGVLATRSYRGGFLTIIHAHLRDYRQALGGAILYSAHLFSAQIIGLIAGRRRLILSDSSSSAVKKLIPLFLVVGVSGAVFTAMCSNGPLDDRFYYLGQAVDVATAPALAFLYALGFLYLLDGSRGRFIIAALAPAGRMSMSNYLFQSLVFSIVFTGYGFGLYGTIGHAVLGISCLALYLVELAFSSWIMSRMRYGPVEAVLRRITLGRMQMTRPRIKGSI
ncbi:DUF418 domain-containing protein [Streptomyces sp. NPDC048489]|uniref:DUF418 domain-containing protein n=1 Tax=Streptomyces sp. NPDC048489 TaxID=3154504 RepID=UPI003436D5A3